MSEYRYNSNKTYEGSSANDDRSGRKRSNPEDKILPIFLIIAVFMFATGHYPHIF